MSAVDAWLAGRRPSPPTELSRRVAEAVPGEPEEPRPALEARALDALDEARDAPGRVRESAYHLLTADALLTYASEAALDEPDPRASLEELVRRAASPDR